MAQEITERAKHYSNVYHSKYSVADSGMDQRQELQNMSNLFENDDIDDVFVTDLQAVQQIMKQNGKHLIFWIRKFHLMTEVPNFKHENS